MRTYNLQVPINIALKLFAFFVLASCSTATSNAQAFISFKGRIPVQMEMLPIISTNHYANVHILQNIVTSPREILFRIFNQKNYDKNVDTNTLMTMEDIEKCAAAFGLDLRLSTLGPFYRIVAKRLDGKTNEAAVGYTSGFIAPWFGLVHLDTMQVRRRYWKELEGKNKFRFGCGMILGAAAMRYAYDNGCKKAELLAINDDPKTHSLLKTFYKIAGFVEVREVTNDVLCIPDLMVWGGVGTRMDMPVETYLRKWSNTIISQGR